MKPIQTTRGAIAAFALVLFASVGAQAETIPAESGGDITITPVQHAAFAMTWNGVTIYNDPAPAGGTPQAIIDAFKAAGPAQIILVSDIHGDHFSADVLAGVAGDATIVAPQAVVDKLPDALKGKAKVLANGAKTELNGVTIEAIPMYNITEDRKKFHEKGRGNGYVVTLGGKRVYIAGDTEDTPEMRALTDIDVAFLPMVLPYTMDVEHAADAVKAFKPVVTIPYHYGESDVAKFKELVADASDVRLLKWY